MEDLVELVDVIPTLEERPASEKLRENTANRPYIDCFGVYRSVRKYRMYRIGDSLALV